MRKSVLILLTFVPLVIGYIASIKMMTFTMTNPTVYYLVIFFSTVFWFCLGMLYSRSNWNPIMSVLVAHAGFICSILLYWRQWQSSIMFTPSWVNLSSLFTASTPIVLIARKIAIFFEMKPYEVSRMERHIVLHIVALVYMIIVFCLGLYFGKKIRKEDKV